MVGVVVVVLVVVMIVIVVVVVMVLCCRVLSSFVCGLWLWLWLLCIVDRVVLSSILTPTPTRCVFVLSSLFLFCLWSIDVVWVWVRV